MIAIALYSRVRSRHETIRQFNYKALEGQEYDVAKHRVDPIFDYLEPLLEPLANLLIIQLTLKQVALVLQNIH